MLSGMAIKRCKNCKGTGEATCLACEGHGEQAVEEGMGSNIKRVVTCPSCKGTGRRQCAPCKGKGSIE